ncbi:mechanosensitive ion channel family protein [Clostridium celatum]|uniref:Putative small-conductance mechanosensitive channel n=1 Tax=Clostridium celatum DSM 1785 TaxID=545697 RepID=L1QLV7_9CLOT|nr:mechanosensitive ion channel domain-containing protein [Clostridium celatum]EKY28916.1 putative small-conductance mechanosensitive channel [Clostridium celatum DSM 1785]MCE9655058.1 mechanosensitive ion channel [Clostridium celatum]
MNMSLEKYIENIITWASTKGIKLIIGILMLYIGWKIVNKLVKIMNRTLQRRNVDATLSSFLDTFVEIALKIIVVVIFMGYVGIDTAGIAALVASAGVAIGLALQGSLSNFAGGVIILLIRPFNVGDYVEGSGHSGTIEKIGIFYTHMTTVDNKLILIPNGNLANGSIVNYSAKELRRVDLTFGVGYEEDIIKVKRVLSNIIEAHESILKTPEPFIALSAHGDSAVNFVVRVWCNNKDYWKIYFDLLEQVKLKFDEENISIPYPQMDLHIKRNILSE